MKAAEDWAPDIAACAWTLESKIRLARRIQADALRYAANLSGEERDAFLLALADKLDPQPAHPKTMSFVPERDPNDLYGPMGGNAEPTPSKDYKPGPETPHEVIMDAANKGFPPLPADQFAQLTAEEKQHLSQYVRRPLHPPRILLISIATEPTGGFQLATQLKFNDLSSPTQAQAILDTLEELDARLSAALGYSPI